MDSSRSCTLCDYKGDALQCPTEGSPTLPTANLRSEDHPRTGRVIGGRYRLLSLLGRGGMGEVWFGEHSKLRQPIAAKLIRDDALETKGARARFEREALLVSRLQHPHVVRVFDYGYEDDEGAYLVMEYLEGVDLAEAIKRDGPLPVALTVHIAKQVTSALCGAHERGLVHRDLKPANIFLQDDAGVHAFAKVLDFGIAKPLEPDPEFESITRSGAVVGSPPYMAPEQAMSESLSAQTDLYALGIVLYEMLSGTKPFKGTRPLEILMKHINEAPPPLARDDIPPALRGIIFELLHKNPDDRPPSAEHVLGILDELSYEIPGRITPMGGKPIVSPITPAEAESHTEPAALQEAPTTIALPARSSRLRWLAMVRYNPLSVAFILLGGVWVLSATEAQRTTQEAEIAQAPESPRALSANQATHPDSHGSMKPQTPGKEDKQQGDTPIAAYATPKEEANLALDIQPDTARVYIRAAASTEPFKLLSTGSGSAKIPHGSYEIKVTDRQKKVHRQRLEIPEDLTLRVRLKKATAPPKPSAKPTLPE